MLVDLIEIIWLVVLTVKYNDLRKKHRQLLRRR